MRDGWFLSRFGPFVFLGGLLQGCPVDDRALLLKTGGSSGALGPGGTSNQGGSNASAGGGEAGDDEPGPAGAAGTGGVLPVGGGTGGGSGGSAGSGGSSGSGGTITSCAGTHCSCFGSDGNECHDDSCCRSSDLPTDSFWLGGGGAASSQASVDGFGLDKYEVTVGRFRKYVDTYAGPPNPEAGEHPFVVASGWQASFDQAMPVGPASLRELLACDETQATWTDEPAGNETFPINCVTWYEAFAFCIWDGGRLPTEAEWEYAASGAYPARDFPWGDEAPSADRALYDCGGRPIGDCTAEDLLPVGSKPAGAARFAHRDLAGSIAEWVLDWHAPYADPCNNCANVVTGSERVTRGGSFLSARDSDLRATERAPEAPGQRFSSIGVRCARD